MEVHSEQVDFNMASLVRRWVAIFAALLANKKLALEKSKAIFFFISLTKRSKDVVMAVLLIP